MSTRHPRAVPHTTAVLKGFVVAFATLRGVRGNSITFYQPHKSSEQNGHKLHCGRLKGVHLQSGFVCWHQLVFFGVCWSKPDVELKHYASDVNTVAFFGCIAP